jgi:general secretion pathway protein I
MQGTRRLRRSISQSGITLLEVLIAISLLGISFAAVFSGLHTALRSAERLDGYQRAVELASEKLDEFVLDPTVAAGEERSAVLPSGIRWEMRADLVDTRPLADPHRPAQLVRIHLQVLWPDGASTQKFSLQTLKLCIPEQPPSSP